MNVPNKNRWQVSWTTGSAIKRVDITDAETGRRAVGRDWASWDVAFQQAWWRLFTPEDPPRSFE